MSQEYELALERMARLRAEAWAANRWAEGLDAAQRRVVRRRRWARWRWSTRRGGGAVRLARGQAASLPAQAGSGVV